MQAKMATAMASTSAVANRLGAKQAFGSSSGLKPAARSGALARARIVVRAEKSQVCCGLQSARRPAVGLCIWSYLFSLAPARGAEPGSSPRAAHMLSACEPGAKSGTSTAAAEGTASCYLRSALRAQRVCGRLF